MEDEGLATRGGLLASKLKEVLLTASSREEGMRRAVEAIRDSNPLYHWAGIYLLEGDELVLAHEVGKPTPHRRISLDKGICGAAAREGRTIIVDDVNADPRYLACSLETRSEIVVPMVSHGRTLGEIDIDSDRPAAFDSSDGAALEEASLVISEFIEQSAWSVPGLGAAVARRRSPGREA